MIGRQREIAELKRIYDSQESEFVMVYGRRRVGKTCLVREFFQDRFVFSCTGIANGTREEELMNFRASLARYDEETGESAPDNWMKAFELLERLTEKASGRRKVIFLDEVPWMYTQKSDFLKGLEHFWNAWASWRKDIILVICGSAASWLVKKIVKSKGGLHNRLTLMLKLQQFTLKETQEYLVSRRIHWDQKTIAECYMVLGGIPYYLKLLDRTLSLSQNMDRLFFGESALLEREFGNLYASLFRDSGDYIKIVEVLARKKSGYTRDEIIRQGKFTDGGNISEKIEDLEECGFVRKYRAIGEVSHIYHLVDFYSLFYFQFLKKNRTYDTETWMHLSGKPVQNTWFGLAFERLCLAHLPQIKTALGISGISTNSFTYYSREAQVDLIIERGDKMVNLCEMKYNDAPYTVTMAYAEKLKAKLNAVKTAIRRKRTYSIVLITAAGLNPNEYSSSLIQRDLTLDVLFT